MKVFGIAGHSGMGKTTLLERLIPELTSRNLTVSLIKHSHKSIEIDRPGKDSYRLREAGCMEVVLLGNERWALMHELRSEPEPSIDYLLGRLQHCDIVLIEGFKNGDFPKIEVWRKALNRDTLWPQWPGIIGIASDEQRTDGLLTEAAGSNLLWFDLTDVRTIASFVIEHGLAV